MQCGWGILCDRKACIYLLIIVCTIDCLSLVVVAKRKAEPKPAPHNDIKPIKGNFESDVKNRLAYKLTPESFEPWLKRNCFPLRKLLNRKAFAVGRMETSVQKIKSDTTLSSEEKQYHVQTFRIFAKELNETESGIIESLEWLDMVLKGDFKHLVNLQEKTLARLNYLKDAVLVEEQEYQDILVAQVRYMPMQTV